MTAKEANATAQKWILTHRADWDVATSVMVSIVKAAKRGEFSITTQLPLSDATLNKLKDQGFLFRYELGSLEHNLEQGCVISWKNPN